MNFDAKIKTLKNLFEAKLIIDIKTSIKNFVNVKYVKKHKIFIFLIAKKVNLRLTNNFIEHALTRITIIKIHLKNYINEILCLITFLNKFDVILKILWIKKHKVVINDNNRFLIFCFEMCIHNCLINKRLIKILNKTFSKKRFKSKFFKQFSPYCENNSEYKTIFTKIFVIIIEKENHKIIVI